MSRVQVRGWLVAAILALLAAGALDAADPFYENLLLEGKAAASRKDLPAAVQKLRLASFGLLEEPERLAECLVHLALAQAEADERDGFLETFDRLLEVEERFNAYSEAHLAPSLRYQLEAGAERWVEPEKLVPYPVFAPLARRLFEAKLATLPPDERRAALAQRVAEEPSDDVWRMALARLELEAERPDAAVEALGPVLDGASPPAGARCLNGRARALAGDCAAALPDLGSCPDPAADPPLAELLLGCRVALGQWREAQALLAALPTETAERREVRRLAREVRKGLRTIAQTPTPPPRPTPVETAPGEDVAAEIAELRGRLATASPAELDGLFNEARALADTEPASARAQHLVAEIAYRTSRWPDVVEYFRRGGEIDDSRPDLHFYHAVALYETGERDLAVVAAERFRGRLRESEFVRRYLEKILGDG